MICKLSDIVNTANTGADAIKKAPILNEPTNLRCLRIGDVSQKRDFSMWGYTKTSKMDYERYKLHKGDSIIARTGNTIGVCTYIEDDIESVYNNGLIRLTAKKELARERFLFYLIRSTACQDYIQSIAYGTSTQPNMKIKDFLNFDIIVPTLEIQDKIIAIVDKIEKKIQVNTEINNNLEQQTQAIFKSWFVDFELNYGIMPSDWKVSQLGSIAKISTEVFSPAKNPNVEVEHYSIPAYDEKRYPVFETSNGIKSNKYRLSSNSVMISKLNPDTKRIWRPYCISDNPICSTEFIVYEPINPLNRDFIYSIIDSIGFSAFLCSHTTGSTNSRQRATPSITLTYDIIVPDEKTIQAFCSIVSPMYDTIENNIKENQKLAETRDKLLPKLMSGKLDVSDIDL